MSRIEVPESWGRTVRIVSELPEDAGAWLSEEEASIARAIRHATRRRAWIATRIAAKSLALELGLCREPRELSIPTRGEPPRLENPLSGHDLHLSLSHSGDHAAAAIDQGKIGIDIQIDRRIVARATRLFLNEGESQLLERLPRPLLHLWSAKEAALKAAGARLYREVRFEIEVESADGAVFSFAAPGSAGTVETRWDRERQFVVALARERR
jgi:phosphopantetheinyl transferase